MAHTRLINVNGSAGAFTAVYATQITRRVEIIEDFSANGGVGQGLAYQFDDGQTASFTQVYEIAPETQPILLGTPIPQGSGSSLVLGHGPDASGGYSIPATLLINLRSASATATTVRVTEFD
ncbi:MAG TPA: hypothetical protein VGR96_15725 [Acidobacteriaceae bacterium]|nr:hypothetical protein [Acidobacteriaceae bacterium]